MQLFLWLLLSRHQIDLFLPRAVYLFNVIKAPTIYSFPSFINNEIEYCNMSVNEVLTIELLLFVTCRPVKIGSGVAF